MVSIKKLFSLFCLLFLCGHLLAQQTDKVALVENDGKMAIFSVSASAPDNSDVVPTAIRGLFEALINEGVEGFENGSPLMQKENPKWKANFFKEKNPPYMTYVKGIQSEGEPRKNNVGAYQTTVLIKINADFLIRQLKAYGVMKS